MMIVRNQDDLKSLASFLHDARFTVDGLEFNRESRIFTFKSWVFEPYQEGDKMSRRWVAYLLRLEKVMDLKLNVREKVSYYELGTLHFVESDKRLDFVAHYGVEISIRIEAINGALSEIGETRSGWI